MWIGQFQLGDFLSLRLQCETSAGVPTVPDDTPTAKIYDATGTLIETINLPVLEPNRSTGWFGKAHRLGSSYSTGRYAIRYTFAITSTFGKVECFEIVDGGSTTGAVIGMTYYERPHARFVVYATDDGSITAGKNPR